MSHQSRSRQVAILETEVPSAVIKDRLETCVEDVRVPNDVEAGDVLDLCLCENAILDACLLVGIENEA